MTTPAEHEPRLEMAATNEDRLAEDILAVLSEAKAGLTEDDILAVITIRRERTLFAVLEDLILRGEINATREAPSDRVAMSGDFAFWALADEEVSARRRGSDDGAPPRGTGRHENPFCERL